VTVCVTGTPIYDPIHPALIAVSAWIARLARLASAGRHGPEGRRRRARARHRGVAHAGRSTPVGRRLDQGRARTVPRPPLLPLCRRVEPLEAVPDGTRLALPMVPRRQPGRFGATPRAHRPHHRGDRPRPADAPRASLPALPYDVVAPERGPLHGGRSGGPSGLPRVPSEQWRRPGIRARRLRPPSLSLVDDHTHHSRQATSGTSISRGSSAP
jgi:hypothetical protein